MPESSFNLTPSTPPGKKKLFFIRILLAVTVYHITVREEKGMIFILTNMHCVYVDITHAYAYVVASQLQGFEANRQL